MKCTVWKDKIRQIIGEESNSIKHHSNGPYFMKDGFSGLVVSILATGT